jgi:hypothetical protein
MTTLEKKARSLGAQKLSKSTRKGKKYMVLYLGRWIHFGAAGMSDYTIHKDPERRRRYLARASQIKDKNGNYAYKDKTRPAFWSYYLTWS